jgi:hypothetical protein
MYDLIIGVYACDKVLSYFLQLQVVRETWGQEVPLNVKILYFLGERRTGLWNDEETFIHLPGVEDDCLSASYKQFLGMRYIHQHYHDQYRFGMFCGTDTYPVIERLIELLKSWNPEHPIYMGGHGCYRSIGDEIPNLYFHSGGPGFILSYAAVEILYPSLGTAVETWLRVCHRHNLPDLFGACDVATAYLVHTIGKGAFKIVIVNIGFMNCNLYGYPCHVGQVNMDQILSCHNMSLNDFHVFYKYLQDKKVIQHKNLEKVVFQEEKKQQVCTIL